VSEAELARVGLEFGEIRARDGLGKIRAGDDSGGAREGVESVGVQAGVESGEACAGDGLSELARRVCHRQLGVGADGLIVCRPEPLTMDIINSDGSVAPMCGNGIRCFARYCIEEGVVRADAKEFDVRTLAGVMRVRVSLAGSFADFGDFTVELDIESHDWPERFAELGGFTAEVDMGRPDWSARAAGICGSYAGEGDEFLGRDVSVNIESPPGGKNSCGDAGSSHDVRLSSFFIGTYHTVVWLDENEWILGRGADAGRPLSVNEEIDRVGRGADAGQSLYGSEAIDRVGRALESHLAFTGRTNVDFARVTGGNEVEMITWERGVGLTAACGTGACSVAALGVREGRFDGSEEVRVALPYGELFIRVDESGEVFMRGPAERVFDGEYFL
jgi:diaminopimelate epimerase